MLRLCYCGGNFSMGYYFYAIFGWHLNGVIKWSSRCSLRRPSTFWKHKKTFIYTKKCNNFFDVCQLADRSRLVQTMGIELCWVKSSLLFVSVYELKMYTVNIHTIEQLKQWITHTAVQITPHMQMSFVPSKKLTGITFRCIDKQFVLLIFTNKDFWNIHN